MSNDNFDSNVDMQTLFHLLGQENQQTLTNSQINKLCEQILTSFHTLFYNHDCKAIMDNACLVKYKLDLIQVLQASEINIEEMEQYSENDALWVEFLTLIYLLIAPNAAKLNIFLPNEVRLIVKNIQNLDKTLRLKLNLYF